MWCPWVPLLCVSIGRRSEMASNGVVVRKELIFQVALHTLSEELGGFGFVNRELEVGRLTDLVDGSSTFRLTE